MQINSDPDIDRLIVSDAPVAIGVSGGKDSQAAALATFHHLDRKGHCGPRILIHADLGSVEWEDSLPVCEVLAKHLGCDLVTVQRKAGGMMERWEARWQSSKTRYEMLTTVTLVPCWSTPSLRFCTSEQKTHVILAELKRRFGGQPVINVTGVRRAESRKRARMNVADLDRDGRVWNWRPIIDLSETEVFAMIVASGLAPHRAYREFGMSRVSCRFCIMSSLPDLTAASAQEETHDIYRRMVALEADSAFAFQGARWLADIAPHLLDAGLTERIAEAKEIARARRELEGALTPGMLYVKGWPTRMLTDEEAETLSFVRRYTSGLYGFQSRFIYPEEIHQRYSELMDQNAQRLAA
ncbi:hypothetical protein BTN45_06655 [Rhizobium sp. ZX09]|nr:hypothetical protein BTN45_06655 [Rhizobium sp. ZX09]